MHRKRHGKYIKSALVGGGRDEGRLCRSVYLEGRPAPAGEYYKMYGIEKEEEND